MINCRAVDFMKWLAVTPRHGRTLSDVFQQAVQLPERDRATLAGLLIETLDPLSEPDVEAAWSEEIERRLA
jgi:Putative addiction module component